MWMSLSCTMRNPFSAAGQTRQAQLAAFEQRLAQRRAHASHGGSAGDRSTTAAHTRDAVSIAAASPDAPSSPAQL